MIGPQTISSSSRLGRSLAASYGLASRQEIDVGSGPLSPLIRDQRSVADSRPRENRHCQILKSIGWAGRVDRHKASSMEADALDAYLFHGGPIDEEECTIVR